MIKYQITQASQCFMFDLIKRQTPNIIILKLIMDEKINIQKIEIIYS